MAVTESRQYYSLLTPADLQNCQQGVFTICESKFPLYHKATSSCLGALYFGKHNLAHEHCNKIILRKDFKPVWIHQSGNPNFWIYSLPVATKITKTCRINRNVKSVDLEIQGTGILEEEENCQIFSENFLLLLTASGSSNFTLTRGQVIVPQLPELLTPQETKMITSHLDQADGALRALDSIMTRGLSTTQREISLHELIGRIQEDHNEHNLTEWIVSTIIIILILGILLLTSKYWRQPFLRFSSQIFGR
jgi:hypothetical protein